jgi:hypothetical protein
MNKLPVPVFPELANIFHSSKPGGDLMNDRSIRPENKKNGSVQLLF